MVTNQDNVVDKRFDHWVSCYCGVIYAEPISMEICGVGERSGVSGCQPPARTAPVRTLRSNELLCFC